MDFHLISIMNERDKAMEKLGWRQEIPGLWIKFEGKRKIYAREDSHWPKDYSGSGLTVSDVLGCR